MDFFLRILNTLCAASLFRITSSFNSLPHDPLTAFSSAPFVCLVFHIFLIDSLSQVLPCSFSYIECYPFFTQVLMSTPFLFYCNIAYMHPERPILIADKEKSSKKKK
eukprot:TRINITY_DN11728_c0_g1_i1.p1 TRINITY_DN11728_c0_g1~~TRINITY_DN11728_c0_g1_i1.p1  ORF type:complete len:107 (+),score=5.91 TRINITY_DN11728_c0_g1_i1:138-458(+)